jgi:hypothetical protein
MNKKLAFCCLAPAVPFHRLPLLFVITLAYSGVIDAAGAGTYTHYSKAGPYGYTVNKTGENFSFEFERNPGTQSEKLKAAVNVLASVYEEESLNPRQDGFFMKETAKCFVFDSSWYTYTACFLPNEYSPENKERFWGFVYRVPNGMWLITRNLIPALALLGLSWFFLRSRSDA